ncbi:MAG: hypothetical protein M1830_007954 [Pleopsidium flavum]|nr:MAG: hypothetical protein M1830_007954 [Pleopsidium flavum]
MNDVGSASVVQLLHQTVKDFLANPEAAKSFFIQLLQAEWMVESDARIYLQLSLPTVPMAYAPVPTAAGSGWEANVEEVVSYLEEELLVAFVLTDSLSNAHKKLLAKEARNRNLAVVSIP